MGLDYDLIKEILETVGKNGNGISEHHIDRQNFEVDDAGYEEFCRMGYHYKILIDNNLIYGKIMTSGTYAGKILDRITYTDLTLKGHQTLEAMKNKKILDRIKKNAEQLGIRDPKEIPALALGLLSEND